MITPNLSRTGVALALSTLIASVAMPVQAQQAPSGSPLFPANSLTPAIKDRMFLRMSYVYTFTKTKSEDARDVSGPVVTIADLNSMQAALPAGSNAPGATLEQRQQRVKKANYRSAIDALAGGVDLGGIYTDYVDGLSAYEAALGTPLGIKAKAGNAGTVALSVGYYFGNEHNWAVEALVLGAPLTINVYGDGANGLNGKKLISTKMLPPTALIGYYFGEKNDAFRPYLGVGAMYAIFFDTKVTQEFNDYQGGVTSATTKNAFGVGPFVGLQSNVNSDWYVNFSLGRVRLKSEATLVTRNTTITSASPVIQDYGPGTVAAIREGTTLYDNATVGGNLLYPNGFTTSLMSDLAAYKQATQGGDGTLGTFVRKQKNQFDNTIVMLSVGKSF